MSDLDLDTVRRLWDENADDWAAGVRGRADLFRDHYNNPAFLRLLGDVRGSRLLDAGCGEGTNTRLFRQLGADVVGIDISERMIEHARRAETQQPLGISYEIASFTDLRTFSEGAFDVVVSTMALMDAPDLDGALREFARVLRAGGRLVFSVARAIRTPNHSRSRSSREPSPRS